MTAYGNYDYPSFGWPLDPPIIPYSFGGVTFPGGVHHDTPPLWNALLRELTPHIPGGLHPGWCWGYDFRPIRGGSKPSFHRGGLALDINAPVNPYRADGTPATHQMPAIAAALAKKYLMEWGGSWQSPKDYMHFEIHGSPAEVKALIAHLSAPAPPHFQPYKHMTRAAYGSRIVQLWSAGDDVRFVQQWIGPSRAGAADGYFGNTTRSGVLWYQKLRGLPADGIVGARTWAQMEPR